MDDPLRAVILDIVHGWGDLADEDLKRLEMFRPEKIIEETDKIVLPKDRKAGEHATLRLARIREHAAKLQAKTQPTAASREPSPEAVGGPDVLKPAEEAEPAKPEQPEELERSAAPEGFAAPQPLAAPISEEPAPMEVMTSVETVSSWGAAGPWAAVSPAEAAVLWEPVAVEGLPATEAAEEGAAEEAATKGAVPSESSRPAGSTDWMTTVPSLTQAEPPVFWAEDAEEWGVKAPEVPQETPAPPEEVHVEAEDLPKTAWGTGTAVAAAGALQDEESFSSLRPKVRTADDVMTLPGDQRADMLVFLEPDQLTRVFGRTDDPELKKGVIDSLEHLGNTSALGALRLCLDDPNPEIQLYALEAADRLLGVD